MKFGNPGWLWATLAIPALYALAVWQERRRQAAFARFAAPATWAVIAPEADFGARLRKARVWLLALAFALVAMARPQTGAREESVKVTGLDILVALDVSNSMETEDVVPSRLKKSKHFIRTLAGKVGSDRLGLVAFAASSYVACPLTTDIEYFLASVEMMGPRMVANQGTDLGIALESSVKSLDRGAEENGAVSSKVILLISDGEDHEEGATAAAKKLAEAGVRLYVFGVGTQRGGPVPIRDDYGNLISYKKDRSGQGVVSKFDPAALTKLASDGGGRYWNITPDEAEVDELVAELKSLSRGEFEERKVVTYEERFQIPLLIAVLLLLGELSIPMRKLLVRAGKAGKGGGKLAAVLALALGAAFVGPGAAPAEASPTDGYQAWRANRDGVKSLNDGKAAEAKKSFEAAQDHAPDAPELEYNQGLARAKEGDVDAAIAAFDNAARKAADSVQKGADPTAAGKVASAALYNKGSALATKGDVPGAVGAYLDSIEAARASGNAQVEADARKNLELLASQPPKKGGGKSDKQDKDKDKKGKDNKDQQSQDQKDQKDKGDKQDQKQEQAKNKDFKNPPKQKEFKSAKLNQDDAERVMAELKNREKQLHGRLKKQNGNQHPNSQDW